MHHKHPQGKNCFRNQTAPTKENQMNKPNTRSGNYLEDNYDDYLEEQERQEVESSSFTIDIEGEN